MKGNRLILIMVAVLIGVIIIGWINYVPFRTAKAAVKKLQDESFTQHVSVERMNSRLSHLRFTGVKKDCLLYESDCYYIFSKERGALFGFGVISIEAHVEVEDGFCRIISVKTKGKGL